MYHVQFADRCRSANRLITTNKRRFVAITGEERVGGGTGGYVLRPLNELLIANYGQSPHLLKYNLSHVP